jgi:hypothetical protein
MKVKLVERMKASKKQDNHELLKALNSGSSGAANTTLATDIFDATVPTAALFSKAIVHAVDYFLDDGNKQARGEIVDLFSSEKQGSSAKIMDYVREALRLNPIVSRV